jgi:hypothetical protein
MKMINGVMIMSRISGINVPTLFGNPTDYISFTEEDGNVVRIYARDIMRLNSVLENHMNMSPEKYWELIK